MFTNVVGAYGTLTSQARIMEVGTADTDYNTGDTVFIREDAGTQFVLDGQAVAAVSPGEIIYHKVKK